MLFFCLELKDFFLIMSHTRFRVNPHSREFQGNYLLETGAKSEV